MVTTGEADAEMEHTSQLSLISDMKEGDSQQGKKGHSENGDGKTEREEVRER